MVVVFGFSIVAILNKIEIGTELLNNLGIEIETEKAARRPALDAQENSFCSLG